MSRLIIYPYKMGSQAAKGIQQSLPDLRTIRVRPDGRYQHNWNSHVILNWGCTDLPNWFRPEREHLWLNKTTLIARAVDKSSCLRILRDNDINVPEFTTNGQTAYDWLRNGNIVYCRTLTRASAGRGIVIATEPRELVNAPLYTKQVPIKGEYRVHIFKGRVVDYQKKRRVQDLIDQERETGQIILNQNIRNLEGGWVYTRGNLNIIEDNKNIAIDAIEKLGLDFGAVDIIRTPDKRSIVLEVNTAPGLVGTTLTNYTNTIREIYAANTIQNQINYN